MKLFQLASIALAGLLISGCSVKQEDDGLTKVAKHTANAPLYAVLAVGMAGTMLGGGMGYAVSKTSDALAGREWYQGETFVGIVEREALDANSTLAPFYEDVHFVVFKDAKEQNYLYFKDSSELIHTKEILNRKRWAIAGLEGRPVLPYVGVRLPESITKEMVEEKAGKDRFGNPVFIGQNSLAALRPRRDGWLMSLKYEMFVLPANIHSFAQGSRGFQEWLEVNFPKEMEEAGELRAIRY